MRDEGEREREERARGRRQRATLRRTSLTAAEPEHDAVAGPEALSLVTELTRMSWSWARLAVPTYERANIPVRFVPGRLE